MSLHYDVVNFHTLSIIYIAFGKHYHPRKHKMCKNQYWWHSFKYTVVNAQAGRPACEPTHKPDDFFVRLVDPTSRTVPSGLWDRPACGIVRLVNNAFWWSHKQDVRLVGSLLYFSHLFLDTDDTKGYMLIIGADSLQRSTTWVIITAR